MKKLYKKGTVHPTPPLILDQLSFLPATILTLAAALSLEDREVLAYLLSCSSNNYSGNKKNVNKTTAAAAAATTATAIYNSNSSSCGGAGDHPPSFNCSCFRCYMSYWVRWDASPNRQVIHEIIDAFEEGLIMQGGKKEKSKRERRKNRRSSSAGSGEFKKSELNVNKDVFSEPDSVEESSSAASGGANGGGQSSSGEDGEGEVVEGLEKGSVRRLVSFLGEKIWSVWT